MNVVASVSNGYTPEDRLEGMNFQIGDWHAGVKIFLSSKNTFLQNLTVIPVPCTLIGP